MIIGVTVLIVLAIVLLTFHLHNASKMEVLYQFQDHQLVHAQHLAYQVKFFFHTRSQELQALSSLLSREPGDFEKRKKAIEDYSKMMEYVKAVDVYNERGDITYATGGNTIKLDGKEGEFFSWAKGRENRGKVLGLPLVQPNSVTFFLVAPVYRDSSDGTRTEPDGKFDGVVTVAVDLKEFLVNQLHVLASGINVHQVWIMDKGGNLLFQSGYKEMAHRNVYRGVESCWQCHPSLDHVEKILKAREGTIEYKMKDFPRKIAAFAPMDFEDMSWIVVVSSPYDAVTAVIKKSLHEHLGLLGVVVLAAILGSASIIRTDRFKVKAEEEVKHLREKSALEEKIHQSEALYRTIVENAHDAIWSTDTEGHFIFGNRRTEEISGFKVSELVGKDFEPLIPREDLPRTKDLLVSILHGKAESFEARFYTKDRQIRLLSVNAVPLYENGRVVGMFNIGRDITEQRNVEKALRESEKQLRFLSSQLLTTQETERKRISKELHDELGGALTAIKLRLRFVEKGLKQDQVAIGEECEGISRYVDQVIEEVRRLSRDLSPSILEDAGLLVAIRWLIGNSSKTYHINMTMDVMDVDDLFPQDAKIIIYRILQEALTNIGRHAQAKNASVMIKKHDDGVSFSIEDDGVGFDMLRAPTVNPEEKGLGLAIMEERVRMLGGALEIRSEKGKGTRISFYVPLERR